MPKPLRFVILASGKGSNALSLLEFALEQPQCFVPVGLVSDKPDTGALEHAKRKGIPAQFIPHKEEERLLALFREWKPDWALLAGYMRLLSPRVLDFFRGQGVKLARVLNVHPSLLPAYPGLHAYERAFADGVKESGVTIHFVDEGLDTGPVVLQESFPRLATDTLADFVARGQKLEHKLYRVALERAAAGKIGEESR